MKLSNVLGPSILMTTTDLEQMVSIYQRKTQFSRLTSVLNPIVKPEITFSQSLFCRKKTGRKQI